VDDASRIVENREANTHTSIRRRSAHPGVPRGTCRAATV